MERQATKAIPCKIRKPACWSKLYTRELYKAIMYGKVCNDYSMANIIPQYSRLQLKNILQKELSLACTYHTWLWTCEVHYCFILDWSQCSETFLDIWGQRWHHRPKSDVQRDLAASGAGDAGKQELSNTTYLDPHLAIEQAGPLLDCFLTRPTCKIAVCQSQGPRCSPHTVVKARVQWSQVSLWSPFPQAHTGSALLKVRKFPIRLLYQAS